MSDGLVSVAALRTARMLKNNAPQAQIDTFVAQMAGLARRHGDAAREAFWREVAALMAREPVHCLGAGVGGVPARRMVSRGAFRRVDRQEPGEAASSASAALRAAFS